MRYVYIGKMYYLSSDKGETSFPCEEVSKNTTRMILKIVSEGCILFQPGKNRVYKNTMLSATELYIHVLRRGKEDSIVSV